MFFQMSIFWFTRVEVELEAHITPGGSTHVGYSTTKYELLTPSGSGRTRHRFFLPSDLLRAHFSNIVGISALLKPKMTELRISALVGANVTHAQLVRLKRTQ